MKKSLLTCFVLAGLVTGGSVMANTQQVLQCTPVKNQLQAESGLKCKPNEHVSCFTPPVGSHPVYCKCVPNA
jgi:hypothetical protein